MAVNRDNPDRWKANIAVSVDMYNDWFMHFAPRAFRQTHVETTKSVEATLHATDNLTNIKPAVLREHPTVLATLRMSTWPPPRVSWQAGIGRMRFCDCLGAAIRRAVHQEHDHSRGREDSRLRHLFPS